MKKTSAPGKPKEELISKEVVESYIFSTVRHNFGIYSERLLLRLVELAQFEINGLNFKDGSALGKVTVGEWGHADITIPVKDILSGEDDRNYEKAKAAVRGLMGKFLEYEDDNNYRATAVLNEVDVDKVAGQMTIQVNKNLWNAMLDFSKGFRKYELETAMRLQGKYSLRLYKLTSQLTNPITYSLEDLRLMFGVGDKYKRSDDFIKRTIESAKRELDEKSAFSFDYQVNYSKHAPSSKGGRPTPSSITFFPLRHLVNSTSDQLRKGLGLSLLHPELLQLLQHKLDFTPTEIKAHLSLFEIAQKTVGFDIISFIYERTPKALAVENPKGYIINALKSELKSRFGIIIDDKIIITDKSLPKVKAGLIKTPQFAGLSAADLPKLK